jgi:hypothetical protein
MLKQLNCKGAFVGLESMNKEARISVGKGMAVDRVLDALNNLKSNSNALLYASMIVGLPGDTLDDAYSWYERFKSKELFNDWGFQNLGLTFDEFGQGESIFSKEPAKYGYEVTGRNVDANGIGPRSYQWKSKMGFSDGDAGRVAREINDMSMDIVGAGGFGVADFWYHNGTEHEINNVTRTDFFPARKGSVSGKIRSQERLQEALARLAQNGRTSKFYTNN